MVALVWDLIANDGASGAFTRVGTAAETGAGRVQKMVTALGAVALVDAGYHAVKMAGDFQQATNVLVTAAGETTKNLETVRKGILDIATSTGTDWQQVTDGLYTLEKAGYRGADAIKVETAAAQGAREENANLATVTNALTSIMASYHLTADDAVMVTNELKTAAGESKTTMELFAGSLSTVLPVASANKISFADVAGSLATLTQHGTTADEATQELSNTIRNLSAPNAVAIKEMAQLGISSVDVAQKLGDGPGGRGLAGTLDYLSKTVLEKMGPAGTVLLNTFNQSQTAATAAKTEFDALPAAAKKLAQAYLDGSVSYAQYRFQLNGLPPELRNLAQQWATTQNNADGFQVALKNGLTANQTYTDAIKKMTGGANGLNTTLQVTGESMDGTNARIAAVAEAAKNAGKDVSGWDSTQKLFNVQMDKFKQSAEAAGIEVGTKLIPILSASAGWAAKHTTVILDLVGAFLAYKAAMLAITAAQAIWVAGEAVLNGAVALLGATLGRTTLGLGAFIAETEAASAAEVGLAEESAATGVAVSGAFGPVGLVVGGIAAVIGGAAAAFGIFGGKAKEQVKPVQELTDAVIRDGNAIAALTTTQVNNKLAQDGTYQAARKLGLSSAVVLQATLGNADAQREVTAATKAATDAYNKANTAIVGVSQTTRGATPVYGHATDAQAALKSAADTLSKAVDGENASLTASVQAAKDTTNAIDLMSTQTGVGSDQVLQLKDKLDVLNTTTAAPKIDTSSIDNATTKVSDFQKLLLGVITNSKQLPSNALPPGSIPIPGAPVGRATGDPDWQGGPLTAGENGPERIWLPKHAQIDSAQHSKTAPVDLGPVVEELQAMRADMARLTDQHAQSVDTSVRAAAKDGARTSSFLAGRSNKVDQ